MSFGGRVSIGRFVVKPYSFNVLIMGLMVLRGRFKVSDIFLEPNPDLYYFVPDLCGELLGLLGHLLSGVADSGAIQNRCIYTEII